MKKVLSLALTFSAFLCVTCREVDDLFPNQPPVAKAGENATGTAGSPVTLNASASTDPDDDALSYTWQWLSKPQGSKAIIHAFDSVMANFTPDLAGQYIIRLVVSDNIDSSADTIAIHVLKKNNGPTANAGNDGKADLGVQHPLSGSGSDPDGDPITFSWSLINKPSGSTSAIQNPNSQNASLNIDKPGNYIARLTVSDGTTSATDDVSITTNAVTVAGINPTSGPHGTTVKITGTNFSPVASENTVLFNGTTATVISASYTGLDVTVPKGAGTGMVSVIVNGITANGPSFTYNLSATVTTVAQFNAPIYTASDANGNIYISDYNGNVIRRLTPAGALTIIAGSGQPGYFDDKNPLLAQFDHPAGIAVDANGNIYVADNGNNCIRRISSTNVSTIAGSTVPGYVDAQGGQAQFNTPIGLGIDGSGNLYVGDTGNHRIRRVTSVGVVTTVAGNGQAGFADGNGPLAQFNGIAGVAVDGNNNIYVADGFNHRIRKINGQGVVSTLAGNGTAAFANGTGTAARFNVPYGVACDASGNVYVADFSNHSIRKVTSAGVTTTTAGNGTSGFVDAIGSAARFNQPTAVTVAPNGNIYVADFGNQRIRLISFE